MSLSQCANCGADIEGSVDGIPLKICCQTCATKTKNSEQERKTYGCDYCISKNYACRKHKNAAKQLCLLHSVMKENPSDENGPPMKLFLRAEVAQLKKLTTDQKSAIKAQQRSALLEKKKELEGDFGLDLNTMDVKVRHFLLGDYFAGDGHPKTTLEEVRSRCAVAERVEEVVKSGNKAHPEDVFQFFMENPEANVGEFTELREKVRRVFHLEGTRILYNLPIKDREELKTSALKDAYESFMKRDLRALVHRQLVMHANEATAQEIMDDPSCKLRLDVGGEECAIAKKLMGFWHEKHNSKKREQRLRSALTEKGIAFPLCCRFVDEYCDGERDVDLEDMVGFIDLRTRVRTFGGLVLDMEEEYEQADDFVYMLQFFGLFLTLRHDHKLDYADAIDEAERRATPYEGVDSDDDERQAHYFDDEFLEYLRDCGIRCGFEGCYELDDPWFSSDGSEMS